MPCFLYAITFPPIYTGDSICYKLLLKINSVAVVPISGDVVTLTLQRNPDASEYMFQIEATYVSGSSDHNFVFSANTDEIEDFSVGNAYWYLNLYNLTTKVKRTITVGKVAIKKGHAPAG